MKKLAALLSVTGILAMSAAAQEPAPAPAPTEVTVVTETTPGDSQVIGAEDAGTLPTTGGAPLAMALAGALTTGSAFFLRRKLS